MAVSDVPVDLGRDEAREAAVRELGDPAYVSDDPNPLERAIDWVLTRLGELFAGAGGMSGITAVTVVVAVLVLIVIIVRLRVGRTGRALRSDGTVFGSTAMTAAEHRAAAEKAAAAGDLAEAVRERFRAVVRELEQRGVLDARAGRTVDEVAHEAGQALPVLAGDLRGAAVQFDDVWYGGRPATLEGYQQLVSVDGKVRG
ncbi:DUF4129 domain-containing protein [Lentzea flaviverrucosa]|uniref:Protein-glutamine gamma-glutamyltransferase-like C-terminal domain-containing protein n=1 Tax=Lentzea flaviverrucosa TaxID=200379 RepID=A0A1H9WBL7_9PSEU|nr:DUF4129 domain-containing protein [Lentzea flaviverrucosa]RDI22227.1 uncharacterized protein DUF4129 [Lentzea flaviverrucosa]SES31189.1 protein of unknown function [Lentzea flaviverrucosa]